MKDKQTKNSMSVFLNKVGKEFENRGRVGGGEKEGRKE